MFYGRPEVGDDIYPLVETQSYLRGVNIVDPFHEKAGAFEHPQAIAGLKTLHHYAVGGVIYRESGLGGIGDSLHGCAG